MSSKKVEDDHTKLLNKLLSDSGVECLRPVPESLESFEEISDHEEAEEEPTVEEAVTEEFILEKETAEKVAEEIVEQLVLDFPTPSLRRLMPERLRRIEAHNRIHVMPSLFNIVINPETIPKINSTAPQKYIDILAEMLGCKAYKSSLAEYWVVDTLANLLRRAQEDKMEKSSQVALIHWFCEWLKEMQYFDAATRERMVRRWKDIMLTAAKFIAEERFVPLPAECDVYFQVFDDNTPQGKRFKEMTVNLEEALGLGHQTTNSPKINKESSFMKTQAQQDYECALRDLSKITHYIYDLFSTDFQYELIRSVFCHTPEYHYIDSPYQLQVPKRQYAVTKPTKGGKPSKSPPKKEKDKSSAKMVGKGKTKEPDPEEYIMLMQLKAKDMLQQLEQEEKDREDWNKRSHILPLSFAATDELFSHYWPPPPEPSSPLEGDVAKVKSPEKHDTKSKKNKK